MELLTHRLLLRPLKLEDADDMTRLCQDRTLYENTLSLPWPFTKEMAQQFIQEATKDQGIEQRGDHFAISLKATDEFIGVIGLSPLNRHDDTEVGYWLDQKFRGQGYMTEALKEIIHFAFLKGAHRVSGRHFPWNPASGRVMEKAGMTYEGTQREALKKDDQYIDDVCYAVLKGEAAFKSSNL